MKHITYRQCEPAPGTHVAVYCAGMRAARFQTDNAGDLRDYYAGGEVGGRLPRRLAKKRASRILHAYRMNMRRWCSRGNVQALHAVPSGAGFTRFGAAS